MDSNKFPVISVLMSVYNDIPYLDDAVKSILNQTFQDFEFIIVNDGSTDESLELLKKYAQLDDRIRLFDESNKGLTKELQFALEYVRGKYIARMDGDDIALPERFSHQIRYMNTNPEIICSGTNVIFIDEDSDPIGYSNQETNHKNIEQQLFSGRGGAIYHPTMIAKTSAIKEVGGYNVKYRIGQDLDLFLKLGEVGVLGNSNKVTMKFRRYHKSTTALEENKSGIERRKEIVLEALHRRNSETNEVDIKIKPPQTVIEYHLFMGIKAIRNGFLKTGCKHLLRILKNSFKT